MSKSGLHAVLHGEAADVAEALVNARGVGLEELGCALVNALRRVAKLEADLDRLKASAAAREAAAGFDPGWARCDLDDARAAAAGVDPEPEPEQERTGRDEPRT